MHKINPEAKDKLLAHMQKPVQKLYFYSEGGVAALRVL